jgi:hypothetical protein
LDIGESVSRWHGGASIRDAGNKAFAISEDLESERELLSNSAHAIVDVSLQSIAIGPGSIADLEQMRYF